VTVGAYPGTFNPPTVAHLSIAEAARRHGGLDRLDLVVSTVPLGKDPIGPPLDVRLSVLQAMVATRPWLGVRVTDRQLIAEVADGYDAVVVGADKWLQIVDPAWYGGSAAARDEAVARLPRIFVVARPPHLLPPELPAGTLLLDIGAEHGPVSSTAARGGRRDWMAAEAAAYDEITGAWTAPPAPAT
jgi:cytidylyltransferase-like protein